LIPSGVVPLPDNYRDVVSFHTRNPDRVKNPDRAKSGYKKILAPIGARVGLFVFQKKYRIMIVYNSERHLYNL
jgi:hypothetical protein